MQIRTHQPASGPFAATLSGSSIPDASDDGHKFHRQSLAPTYITRNQSLESRTSCSRDADELIPAEYRNYATDAPLRVFPKSQWFCRQQQSKNFLGLRSALGYSRKPIKAEIGEPFNPHRSLMNPTFVIVTLKPWFRGLREGRRQRPTYGPMFKKTGPAETVVLPRSRWLRATCRDF